MSCCGCCVLKAEEDCQLSVFTSDLMTSDLNSVCLLVDAIDWTSGILLKFWMGSCCFGVYLTTVTSFETTGTTGAVTIGFGSDLMTAG